jgi:Coenzyme PQQ synthesis protein D (PqqD)
MEKVDSHAPQPLARETDLVVQKMPDEVMVYDLRSHKAHCLNQTAAFVWRHCDGQRTAGEIAALLGQETGSPVGEDVVWYALDKLNKADLLQGKIALPVIDHMSRRRMVKRVGALLALPAVASLIAPTAHAAVSVIITSKKIADGQCNNQNNPQSCSDDTCCSGTKRTCIAIGVAPGGLVNTACLGVPCAPAGAASPCSSGT